MIKEPFSLYIHIPFCTHKCPYCDFNTYAVLEIPEREYTAALVKEISTRSKLPEWAGRPIKSIYFGGGTPSLFSERSIRRIITAARDKFPVHKNIEISLESNPGSSEISNLSAYKACGVNRISFGAQSFQEKILKELGRIHTTDEIYSAVDKARTIGFKNISLDLMFGNPTQSFEEFKDDLSKAVKLGPKHISLYSLTIEKGTPFYQRVQSGSLKMPEGELVADMLEYSTAYLPKSGFERYEISNYSQPGFEAQHNLAYWDACDYLGVGAGAHSFNQQLGRKDNYWGKRWSNFAYPKQYINEVENSGNAESWRDNLLFESAIFEFFFLGLRKVKGVSLLQFKKKFGISVYDVYPILLKVLQEEGLVLVNQDNLSLTERGLMLADSVIGNFAELEVQVGSESPISENVQRH